MIKTFINALKVPEIRKRLLFTCFCIVIVRLGCLIPVPVINQLLFKNWLETNQLSLGFLDTLTGGSFSEMSIFALNISPYINASIIMQLLTIAIPKLEEMQKDGEDGRQKINQISRYLTIVLAMIESTAMAISFGNSGYFVSGGTTFREVAIMVVAFTAGTAFLMWLGERITERGLGNGISIILLINIVARLPIDVKTRYTRFVSGASSVITGIIGAIVIIAIITGMVALIVLLQDAERRIPVQYARKIQGRKMVGGQASSIPLKVNTSGVIPVIFAMSLLQFPIIFSSFFGVTPSRTQGVWPKILYLFSQNKWFNTSEGEFIYTLGVLIYIALIIFFAYFYTAVTFNPIEIANNLKKQSGFIPGIRPGKPTSDYLTRILNYIIFIGACGLTIVGVLPYVFNGLFGASVSFGGTSLIIIVSVILETIKQIESQMLVRNYKGFLNE
jgi:preprotein translocase subunit SecY